MPTPVHAPLPEAWQQAERQLDAGFPDAAAQLYRQLLDDPQLAPAAHLRLSLIASDRGRYREAVEEAMSSFRTRRHEPELLQALSRRLGQLGETRAMATSALDPSILDGRNGLMQAELGSVLANHHFPLDALRLLDASARNGFRAPALDYVTGQCLMQVGQAAAAEEALEDAVRANPDLAPAWFVLTRLKLASSEAGDLADRLRAAIARRPDGDRDTPMLLHALFAVLDRAGDTDAAWQALEQGRRLRRGQVQHNVAAEQALFEFLGTLKPKAKRGKGSAGPAPVFIVGMPRTGSTVLERILGNHPDIADCGALQDLPRQLRWCCDLAGPPEPQLPLMRRAEGIDFAQLGTRYLAHTRWRARGRAFFTDKLPGNYQLVSHIVRALPQARILHMVRAPMGTCFSALKEWFPGTHNYSYDQQELADHFRRYRALMSQWRALYPNRILDVRYDELVADPDAVMREVLPFLGLPMHEGMGAIEQRTDIVASAGALRIGEPVRDEFQQQWRRYEPYLAPLKERLGALAY